MRTPPSAGGIHLIPVGRRRADARSRPRRPPRCDRDPAFSPDGRRLAYASCAGGAFAACDVHRRRPGARTSRRRPRLASLDAGRTCSILGLAWARDGGSLVYGASDASASTHLWRVGIDGSSPPRAHRGGAAGACRQRLSAAARTGWPSRRPSHDNDIYVFEAGRSSAPVVSSSLDGPRSRPSPPTGAASPSSPSRSGEVEEIWLADADGSNPVQLTHGPGSWQGSPSWSPDGRPHRLRFAGRGRASPTSGRSTQMAAGSAASPSGPLNEVLPELVPRRPLDLLPGGASGRDGDIWRVARLGRDGGARHAQRRLLRARVARRPIAVLRAARRRLAAVHPASLPADRSGRSWTAC